jgi:hypothetical protein
MWSLPQKPGERKSSSRPLSKPLPPTFSKNGQIDKGCDKGGDKGLESELSGQALFCSPKRSPGVIFRAQMT